MKTPDPPAIMAGFEPAAALELPRMLSDEARADLSLLLEAWQEATARLQQTHAALQNEVRRLSDELEIKNRELARKNRLADLGQMAAHVAHEVRNSLVPVTLYLGLLRRRLQHDQGNTEVLGKIVAGCTALDATVNDLLHFTADRDPQQTKFNVGHLVDEIAQALAPQLAGQQIQVIRELETANLVCADREMVRRVVLNLALNALDAMPQGGCLTVTAAAGPDHWEIQVADNGPGLPQEVLLRAFEPFFTTKNNGTGLGLAIVYRIAEVHGGSISAANRPTGGAQFTFSIPQVALSNSLAQRTAA
jgi:signal transduction histidine kinase